VRPRSSDRDRSHLQFLAARGYSVFTGWIWSGALRKPTRLAGRR